ncbi:MAG: hypothetical protein ABIH71_06945, partial [Candidatus Omnitrophota bacterium]
PDKKDIDIQIYLGIYRNFLKFDRDMLGFILFKYFNANWDKARDEDIAKVAQNINALKDAVKKQLEHPLGRQLNRIINRYTVYYTIFLDIISRDSVESYSTIKDRVEVFSLQIKKVCSKKYKYIKSKLWRAAVRSIIYIFITKSVFVILLEVPAIKWFGEEINPLSLAINVSFPALLLFLLVLFTKVPSDENTKKVIEGINEITFKEFAREDPFVLKKPVKRGGLITGIFHLFYSITFFLSFGLVVWGLTKISFNWVSIIIFLFFLAFVSFFGIRIRKSTKAFIITEPKENIFQFFADFFYIPIVAVGKWLSEKFSRINVFVFILDFIIEAPFKVFVQIAEEWTKYVKERKDEIV